MNIEPLPEKYRKLALALSWIHDRSIEETASVPDSGTCNFDSVALRLPRYNKDLVKQAAEIAGISIYELESRQRGWWMIVPDIPAQANRRTKCAERMRDLLYGLGYEAFVYYQMD